MSDEAQLINGERVGMSDEAQPIDGERGSA
jgi:hypothetical protein